MKGTTEDDLAKDGAIPGRFRGSLRTVLGRFATGVTVVTTLDESSRCVGLTVNSFCSVSLDPPVVLWCLARQSRALSAFESSYHYAIHVLGEDQAHLSRHFSAVREDKFTGIPLDISVYRVPLLKDYLSRFICRKEASMEFGDHVIYKGLIVESSRRVGRPLLFYDGQYERASDLALEGSRAGDEQW